MGRGAEVQRAPAWKYSLNSERYAIASKYRERQHIGLSMISSPITRKLSSGHATQNPCEDHQGVEYERDKSTVSGRRTLTPSSLSNSMNPSRSLCASLFIQVGYRQPPARPHSLAPARGRLHVT